MKTKVIRSAAAIGAVLALAGCEQTNDAYVVSEMHGTYVVCVSRAGSAEFQVATQSEVSVEIGDACPPGPHLVRN